MKDKLYKFEKKTYELLGVKKFRKLAFKTREIFYYPFTFRMKKEDRKKMCYNTPDNYVMKKGNGMQDLKDFKKYLYTNAIIHLIALLVLSDNIIKVFNGQMPFGYKLATISLVGINSYCIMLQRYNYIRINHVLEKAKSKENKENKTSTKNYKNDQEMVLSKEEKTEEIIKELKNLKNELEILKNAMNNNENIEFINTSNDKAKIKVIK